MKKAIIIFIFLLVVGGWTAKKFMDKSSKSSEELELFQSYARDYSDTVGIFLTDQSKRHHDKAFTETYSMWKLSPISELDLDAQYDQKAYYLALGKMINEVALAEGQTDARNALIEIGKHYGVTSAAKPPEKVVKAPAATAPKEASSLGESKLGDKRKIPNSNRDDRR